MKIKNQLTNLDVGEVSFVDKGAIGEVFTVLKCVTGDSTLQNELIDDVKKSNIAESIKNLSDSDFVGVMGSMMSRYQEINKGGENNMNDEMIKGIIKAAMEESMTTVNKNFMAVNKSVDEMQKAFKDLKSEKDAEAKLAEEEKQKKANEKSKSADQTDKEDMKAVCKSITDLTGIVTDLAKSVADISDIKKSVNSLTELKLDEVITDFTKRLETVENSENASNQAKDGIAKNAGDGAVKVPFWKSILGDPEQE